MYVMYYASMLRCWQLVRILVRTNHPCLRVGRHMHPPVRPISHYIFFVKHIFHKGCSFSTFCQFLLASGRYKNWIVLKVRS
jgi:hypothetical protein